jgi:hypothetical protein
MPEDPKPAGVGGRGLRGEAGSGTAPSCLLEGWISVCALDRLQNKYLRLENRKSTIHTKCSLQEVAVSKSRQGPNSGSPSSSTDLNKGCAIVFYFIISFISLYY